MDTYIWHDLTTRWSRFGTVEWQFGCCWGTQWQGVLEISRNLFGQWKTMDSGESIEVFKVRTFQIRDLQQNAPERAPESHGYNRMQINSKKSQTDRQFYQSNQLKPIYLGSKNSFFLDYWFLESEQITTHYTQTHCSLSFIFLFILFWLKVLCFFAKFNIHYRPFV